MSGEKPGARIPFVGGPLDARFIDDEIPDVGDAMHTMLPADELEEDGLDAARAPLPFLSLPDVGDVMRTVYPAEELDDDDGPAAPVWSAVPSAADPLDAPVGAPAPFAPLPSLADFEDRIETVLDPAERDDSGLTIVPLSDDG